MVFPVVMYRCESWTTKKAKCWSIDAFELWHWRSLLRVPWTAKSNQSILRGIVLNIHWKDWRWSWSSDTLVSWCESQFTGKHPDAGKEEKEMTEDEMVGRHHWLKGHEFEQTLGDSEGQGSLSCWSPWGPYRESDMTEWLKWTEHYYENSFEFGGPQLSQIALWEPFLCDCMYGISQVIQW